MIIKPLIRDNIALNTHPLGCKENILSQINDIKNNSSLKTLPLNVLIIGGSSGYGLASRIVLASKNKAFTYNVFYEKEPTTKRLGSAGYYNNYFFNKYCEANNLDTFDLNGDCFSNETKQEVIRFFTTNNIKIDLIVYSVASSVRIDPITKEKYVSSLKPIKEEYHGYTIDLGKDKIIEKSIQVASQEEINNTIKVMGGEDYLLWIKTLDEAQVLNENVKAIAYTYIGAPSTYPIYKDGTIGQAKRDLEKKNIDINKILNKYQGKSYIVSAKSVVTKASVYIPTVPLYMSALFKVMKEHHQYESISQHIYRLFNDMIYGNNILKDDNDIVRLDSFELDDTIQNEVNILLNHEVNNNLLSTIDYHFFKEEFLKINGFGFNNINYDEDIDIKEYLKEE
ncbi:MAG: enoyl-[acyl-carrier-protein] reductase FabV [Bacilli bacterium]|jgi:enoyl-[acyl-carrier protein] reductase/trans-2-enoyl-CoA reductase (NAD+)|nr:enoyl-[acyl-carrier-protein] reductase FabV [Bacilli bacterium]